MTRPLTRVQVEELAHSIRLVIDQIDSGELAASRAMTYRLEGALVALKAVLGSSDDPLTALFRKPP